MTGPGRAHAGVPARWRLVALPLVLLALVVMHGLGTNHTAPAGGHGGGTGTSMAHAAMPAAVPMAQPAPVAAPPLDPDHAMLHTCVAILVGSLLTLVIRRLRRALPRREPSAGRTADEHPRRPRGSPPTRRALQLSQLCVLRT